MQPFIDPVLDELNRVSVTVMPQTHAGVIPTVGQ